MGSLSATFHFFQNIHVPLSVGNEAIEKRIVNIIEGIVNIPYCVFMVDSRKREFVFARHLYSYLMYNYTTLSLNEIGKKVKPNRKDAHDVVIHARCVIENVIDFPKDDRHHHTMKAIDMMEGYKRVKQSTEIVNRLIAQQLKQFTKTKLWQRKQKQ